MLKCFKIKNVNNLFCLFFKGTFTILYSLLGKSEKQTLSIIAHLNSHHSRKKNCPLKSKEQNPEKNAEDEISVP